MSLETIIDDTRHNTHAARHSTFDRHPTITISDHGPMTHTRDLRFLRQLIYFRRYAPNMITLELRTVIRVTVTPKRYATLHKHKMHLHTKFWIQGDFKSIKDTKYMITKQGHPSPPPPKKKKKKQQQQKKKKKKKKQKKQQQH